MYYQRAPSDAPRRDSFALDLMEAMRPVADAYVLHVIATRTFLKQDFFETREGVCRVMAPFSEALVQTGREWAKALGPIAEHSATLLRCGLDSIGTGGISIIGRSDQRSLRLAKVGGPFRTPLTGRNRSRVRHDKTDADSGISATLVLPLPKRCKECGVEITARRRLGCCRLRGHTAKLHVLAVQSP